MSRIIAIRHGDYLRSSTRPREESLTQRGKERMRQTGAAVLALEPDRTWQLLSSAAPRALQSADIVGEALGVSPMSSQLIQRIGEMPLLLETGFPELVGQAMHEVGTEYNPDLPLAVVTHLPLVACVAGDPEGDVPYGAFYEYSPDLWRVE